jgi:beta-lactamase class A
MSSILLAGHADGVPGSIPLGTDYTPRGAQVRWLVQLLTSDAPPDLADIERHFVPVFLAKHPAGVDKLIESWRARGPFTVRSYVPVAHKAWVEVREGDGTESILSFVFGTGGRIRIVLLVPAVPIPKIRSWDELDRALDQPDVESSAIAVRLTDAGPQTLHALNADRAMPSGSTFKYYLLHALARAVQDGTVSWDQRLTITPYRRSLPSGDLQDLPDGSRITVAQAAHNMMAISDNTGGDLVLDLLGRQAVEKAVADSGHHDPSLLRPFPMSREVFQLGWGNPEQRARWNASDEDGRREMLAAIAARPITATIADMRYPVHQDGLDWLMSCRDLTKVMAAVWQDARRDRTGTIHRLLTTNTGVPVNEEDWATVSFKGGSNPGVISFSWLAEDHSGTLHLLVLMQRSADPSLVLDSGGLRWTGQQVLANLLPEGAMAR